MEIWFFFLISFNFIKSNKGNQQLTNYEKYTFMVLNKYWDHSKIEKILRPFLKEHIGVSFKLILAQILFRLTRESFLRTINK